MFGLDKIGQAVVNVVHKVEEKIASIVDRDDDGGACRMDPKPKLPPDSNTVSGSDRMSGYEPADLPQDQVSPATATPPASAPTPANDGVYHTGDATYGDLVYRPDDQSSNADTIGYRPGGESGAWGSSTKVAGRGRTASRYDNGGPGIYA